MTANWISRAAAMLALATSMALIVLARPTANPGVIHALDGAIDIHVHCDPDVEQRSIDAIDVAKLARSRGMRGLVLKNHHEPTASQAYLVRKVVPDLEVFGGVTMDLAEGGMNAAAVEQLAHVKGGWGRIVWMPTKDAENHVHTRKENRPFVSVSRGGELLPDVKKVISAIAKNGLALATGHCSPEEDLMLVKEAVRQGVKHIVVTHAVEEPVSMNIAQIQEAVKLGALIEFDYNHPRASVAEYAGAIRKIGPEFCIISEELTDHPKVDASPEQHIDNMTAFLAALGFTEHENDLMLKENPARLLGLSPRAR
jgi:Family of unknown function (DUF6282)